MTENQSKMTEIENKISENQNKMLADIENKMTENQSKMTEIENKILHIYTLPIIMHSSKTLNT